MTTNGRRTKTSNGWTASRGWTPGRSRAKNVGEFVPNLMRPAFEKYGFPAAALLTDWSAIAGNEIASFTAPERLKWPRKAPGGADDAADKGATLILRVSGARALEVEQMRGRLIERINAAFGYRAVSEIRVIQAPLPKPPATHRPSLQPLTVDDQPALADVPEGPLRDAFARIAAGMKARASSDPIESDRQL